MWGEGILEGDDEGPLGSSLLPEGERSCRLYVSWYAAYPTSLAPTPYHRRIREARDTGRVLIVPGRYICVHFWKSTIPRSSLIIRFAS